MSGKYIGAIDQGTTSTRFILFDHHGKEVASAQMEHAQIMPRAGWVEHDALEIWNNSQAVMRECMARAGAAWPDIAAIGITNQRETSVLWNRHSGRPYGHALVWQDTRTIDSVERAATTVDESWIRHKTGLPFATYFSSSKIQWMLDNIPGIKEDVKKGEVLFGTIDSWLIWNLTGGVHITDVSNASRTQLMDLSTLKWDTELLDLFSIPSAILPDIRPSISSEPYGYFKVDGWSIPVSCSLGDQQAALFGQGCFAPGQAKNTYGTGGFLLMNTGHDLLHSSQGLITTVAYQQDDHKPYYALEGSIAIAGALVQWLRDNLGIIKSSDEIEGLARSVPDNGGVYFVPAFSGLFAPYWERDARGVITGLTRFANRGHLARAVLEASAFQTWEIFSAMLKESSYTLQDLRVDGGMVVNDLLMQFQSDILGIPVRRPRCIETTALGAAYGAGLATGFWQDKQDLLAHWELDKEWLPLMTEQEKVHHQAYWKKAVHKSMHWIGE